MRDAGVSTRPAHPPIARRVLSSYILLPALAASVLAGGLVAPGAIIPSAAFAQTSALDDDVPVGPAATLGVLAAMRARRAAAAAAEAAAMKPPSAPPPAAAAPRVVAVPAALPATPATALAVSRPEAAAASKTFPGPAAAAAAGPVVSVEAINAPHAARKTPDAPPAAHAAFTSRAPAAVQASAAAPTPAAAPEVAAVSADEDAVAVDAPAASPMRAVEAEVAPIGPAATVGALASARATATSYPPAQEGSATGSSDEDEAVMLFAAAPGGGLAAADSALPATPLADTSAGGAAREAGANPGATPSPAAAAASGAVPVPAASPAPVEPAPPDGGPRTFLINDGVPPPAPGPASPVITGAPAPVASDPASGEQIVTPEEAPAATTVILPASQGQSVAPAAATPEDASQVVNYEENQQMPLNEPQLHSLQEFMNEGSNTSPLGVELQEGVRRTKNGREIDGLLVVSLQPGSPAERAGVQAGHRQAHDVIEGAAVAASLVFPPAVLAVPVIETIQLGENYDLIIGIDGNRVTNFMDFQDRLRDVQPGETVYLNILRGGKRLQLPVEMPPPDPRKLQP